MASSIEGKVVVVTGAARGLGRDYATYFAADGAVVVLADVDGERAIDVATRLVAEGSRCVGVELDITSPDNVDSVATRLGAEFGHVDVLVNNAGVWRDINGPLLTLPLDVWARAVAVNLTGTLTAVRGFVPLMGAGGRIVNISSMASHRPSGAYGVTKMAVNQLTLALAAELAPRGVTVNCVAPGLAAHSGARSEIERAADTVAATIIGRAGTTRELYAAIRYLCDDDAGWTTGQTLHINGGAFGTF